MIKKIFAAMASLALMGSVVMAGGFAEPRIEPTVIAPAAATANWDGFYAGVTAGQGKSTTSSVVAEDEWTDPEVDAKPLSFAGFVSDEEWEEPADEIVLSKNSDTLLGIYGGYRHSVPNSKLVLGVEAGFAAASDMEVYTAKAQAGYDLGRTLPYVTAGYAKVDGGNDYEGVVYGIGVDHKLNERLTLGAEYLQASDTADLQTLNVRLGIQF